MFHSHTHAHAGHKRSESFLASVAIAARSSIVGLGGSCMGCIYGRLYSPVVKTVETFHFGPSISVRVLT